MKTFKSNGVMSETTLKNLFAVRHEDEAARLISIDMMK